MTGRDVSGATDTGAPSARAITLPPGAGRVLRPLPGTQMTVKVAGADTGGALAILEWAGAPGAGTPPAVHHQDDESIYFLEGEFTVTLGERTSRETAGAFVYVPKGTVHAFANAGTGPARALVVMAPARLAGLMEELDRLPPGPRDRARVAAILQKYHTEPVETPGA